MNHANKMVGLIFVPLFKQTDVNTQRCLEMAQPRTVSSNYSRLGHWKWLTLSRGAGFSAAMPILAHRKKAL